MVFRILCSWLIRTVAIRMLNEVACKYFHIANREEAIAKTCYEVTLGKCGSCDTCDMSSAILEGKKATFERKGMFDPERIEQITVYPVDEAIGGVSGAIVRISDITESKNMEKHLMPKWTACPRWDCWQEASPMKSAIPCRE